MHPVLRRVATGRPAVAGKKGPLLHGGLEKRGYCCYSGDQGAQPMRIGAGTGRLKGNGWGPLALVPEHPEVQGQRRRAEPQACTPQPPAPAPAPARLCPGLPGSLRISARASLKRWRGLRSREADSWKVPGKRPPQRRGGAGRAGGGRRGGGERGRRAGLGSRAHPRLRGQAFNSCQVSPPPRLAGPGLPLKHEPSLPPPPTLRAGRGPCEPGLRASGLQIPCAPSPEACGRYRSRSPKAPPGGGEGGGVRALERRTAGAASVEGSPGEFESRLCPIRTQVPPLPGSLSASPSLRSLPPLLPNHCYPNL